MQPMLEMKRISKSFPGVQALQEVSFSCLPGEVHVLIGENGAGKSTLLKILTGMYRKDEGEIFVRGQQVDFHSSADSRRAGIAMVYQELSILPSLTVAQNIFLNAEKKAHMKKGCLLNERKMRQRASELAKEYRIDIDPYALAGDLPVAKQQMAEILKVLIQEPDIIILDEPTSAIAREEVDKLYQIVMQLKENGKTVIFISHRMEEIFRFGDRATVLKDGKLVDTVNLADIDEKTLVRMMIGREISDVFSPKSKLGREKSIFSVKNLSYGNHVKHVSLEVYEGEIVGIAGLQGHGQPELLGAIAGVHAATEGEIAWHGEPMKIKTPLDGIRAGIGYIPGDRKKEGLMLQASVHNNLAISSLNLRKGALGCINKKEESDFVQEQIRSLSIKTPTEEQLTIRLSGGNQQKIVLGKAIGIHPKVLLFDEPTRGIDVATKQEFYRMMREFANNGVAVIMYSSDLLEIVGLSDRVLAMYEGEIVSEISGDEITEENVMLASVGIKEQEGAD